MTATECRVFGCGMPALEDGKCVRCGDGPGRGPDMCAGECGRRKRRGQLMCGPCWGLVSPAAQAEVLSSWRAWRRQLGDPELLQTYKTAARTAVREVTGS